MLIAEIRQMVKLEIAHVRAMCGYVLAARWRDEETSRQIDIDEVSQTLVRR